MGQRGDIALSSYGQASRNPSPVNRMMASFAADFRDNVDINLGVGYVNENTIPREQISRALDAVVARRDKYRLAFNYGGAEGSPNLIDSIRGFLCRDHIGGLTENILKDKRIVVGANGATSLLQAAAHVLPAGTVVTSDPQYYIFCNYLERLGNRLLPIPEDHEGIRTEILGSRVQNIIDELCFFYVVTVNNPTCNVLSNQRRCDLVRFAAECSHRAGRRIPVFFDCAYENLIHDPDAEQPRSALIDDPDGLVYELHTLSKILAPGLRIGYMIGADGPFMRAIVQSVNDAGFSAALINQEIASYMLDNHVADQVRAVNNAYRAKAMQTRECIDNCLGGECEDISGGQAGFYYYLSFRTVRTDTGSALFRFLSRTTGDAAIDGPVDALNSRVAYLPGEYCVHPSGDLAEAGRRQMRLSYGYEEQVRIEQGIRLISDAVEYARQAAG